VREILSEDLCLDAEVEEWEIAPRFADLLVSTDVQSFQDKVKLLRPMDHLGINALRDLVLEGLCNLKVASLLNMTGIVFSLNIV